MSYFTKFKSGGAFLTFFILWLFSSSAWAQANVINVKFSDYDEGVQYAVDEPHVINESLTLYTTQCHFTTQLRVYDSNEHDGYFYSSILLGNIKSIAFNAGNNAGTVEVYGGVDGQDWALVERFQTKSAYADYEVNFANVTYNCFKVEVTGGKQVRFQSLVLTLDENKVASPTFIPSNGTTFMESLTVTASCATEGATIYYTTNGEIPTTGSYVFPENGLTINETTTIKAMATNGELENSEVVEATYTKVSEQGVVEVDLSSKGYGNGTTITEVKEGAITLSFDNNGGTPSAYYDTGTAVRLYGRNSLTVSAPNVITEVAFTYSGGNENKPENNPATIGSYANDTWTGSAQGSVVFTNPNSSGHWRIQKVRVTYEVSATQVSAPKFEPASGTTFTESLTVTASCATEGAIIYYTTNGYTPTTESEMLTAGGVTINETTTIKAMAAMADGSLDPSTVVEATYTKVVPILNLAELKAQEPGEYTVQLNNAVVTYAEARKAYIQDETAGLYIYGDNTLKAGTSLNGIVTAELDLYNGLYQLKVYGGEFDNVDVTEGVEIPVKTVTLEELAANFAQYESKRVKVENATVTSAFANQNGEIEQNRTTMALRAANGNIQVNAQAVVDIVGYPGMFYETQQLNVITQEDITELQGGKVTATLSFAQEAYSVNLDESITIAAETNSTSAIKYTSGNPAIAKVDETTGEVTGVSAGSTTITASVEENEEYTSATASYTITVIDPSTQPEGTAFVGQYNGLYYAMATTENDDAMDALVVNVVNNKVVEMANRASISWYVNEGTGRITTAAGLYLTAATSGTALKLSDTATDEGIWTWDEANTAWTRLDKSTTRSFIYKESADGFKNYAISNIGKDDYAVTYSIPMPIVNGYIREGLVANDYYGTICLPYAVATEDFAGAEFFSIAGKKVGEDDLPTALVLEEVTELEAGVPYIFSATSEKLVAAYSGEAAETAGSANGLVGSFEGMNVTQGMYLINDENKVQQCGTGCSISTNRAYINMELVSVYTEAAGANVRMLWFDGVETGIDGVTAEDGDQLVDVYTVGGVKVREQVRAAEATQGLQGGIYIVNGKKVAVK